MFWMALQYFDRAVQAEPGSWAYQFNRARAYAQLQQWAPAVDGYGVAAKLFPDDYATLTSAPRFLFVRLQKPS